MKAIYTDAKKFLLKEIQSKQAKEIPSKQAKEILESYLQLPDMSADPVEVPVLFQRLLGSAQNANMKAGVIGNSIGGVENLEKVLFEFNPSKTLNEYSGAPGELLNDIEKKLKPKGKIRKEPKSLWPKYCKTILSAASFFSQFRDGHEFYEWANLLYGNKKAMPALPMIIAAEIEGIGYPLACDFLKELGFIEYGKPDVHVIEIFVGINLCEAKPTPYQVQKVISKIADAAGVSPYNVDKLFWLIGSGKFYNHKDIGKNGKIGSLKQAYIDHVNA